MKRVLLFGADGQLGSELVRALARFEVVEDTVKTTDFRDFDAIRATIARANPELIVNAAAYTDVEKAETDAELAMRINRDAVRVIGDEAKRRAIPMVHYSTDFVFDGALDRPYREDDATNPLSVYGASKLEGERAVREHALVLRTAWVWSLTHKSFPVAILKAARERDALKVVDDQVGNPTFARDLAAATAAILESGRDLRGLYHLAGGSHVSRHQFAVDVLAADPKRAEHRAKVVEPVPTSAFPSAVKRPAFAPLDCSRARDVFGVALPGHQDALRRAFAGPAV